MGLKDNKVFAMQGIPMGARDAEVARFCKDIGWASTQCVVFLIGTQPWWLTAEAPPKVPAAKWANTTVLIEEVSEEQRLKSRNMDKKEQRKPREQPVERSIPRTALADKEGLDKLVQNDIGLAMRVSLRAPRKQRASRWRWRQWTVRPKATSTCSENGCHGV